jgi:hypothetical protein
MPREWTPEALLEMGRAFQPACVLAAAADLDAFAALGDEPMTARALAAKLDTDPRATAILLDALAALDLLAKEGELYRVPPSVRDTLTERGSRSVLAMARHAAHILRRWALLAEAVKTGKPPEGVPSFLGSAGETAAFIGAMDNISRPLAPKLIEKLQPLRFRHLLDVGGGSGTWTLAFLRAVPGAKATLFDLPDVVPFAEKRLAEVGMKKRVTLVPGDFHEDRLPKGADFAWLSAIVHQNSREQNRKLFTKILAALVPGGTLMIRDIVMDPSRTRPVGGALFAVNMLVNTEAGGTFTLEELSQDLLAAGFQEPTLLVEGEWMDSIVRARRP